MKKAIFIALKDVRSALSTPVFFAICSSFLVLSGFFFFALLRQYNLELLRYEQLPVRAPNLNDWVVVPFFRSIGITLVFVIPLISMRIFHEERQSGALEVFINSAIEINQIVLGKFFSLIFMVNAMLLCSFVYPLMLMIYSDPEILPVVVGFLNLSLFAWALSSVGLAFSSLIKNPLIVGISTLVALLVLYMLTAVTEKIGLVFIEKMSPAVHLEQGVKGIITGADLFYFLSLIVTCLFIANRSIESQKWRT